MMTGRIQATPAALAGWLLLFQAAGAVAEPFGVLQVGDARLSLHRDGRFSLTCGGRPLIPEARIVVASVGWKGTGTQADCRLLAGHPTKSGAGFRFGGEIRGPILTTAWRFEQRVAPAGKGFRFLYQVEPLADTRAGEVCLFLDLPLDRWRGGRVLLWPRAEAEFPRERPRRRHFLSATARKAILETARGHRISLNFAKPTLCTVQDMREYRRPLYQLYPRLFRGGSARKGY